MTSRSSRLCGGSVTRLTGRRQCIRLGLIAAIPSPELVNRATDSSSDIGRSYFILVPNFAKTAPQPDREAMSCRPGYIGCLTFDRLFGPRVTQRHGTVEYRFVLGAVDRIDTEVTGALELITAFGLRVGQAGFDSAVI